MDRFVIFTNLKFNYFTHFNGSLTFVTIHGTDRRRRSRKVVACAIYRFLATTLPSSHFYELILLGRLHYMIGELFPNYQSGAKRTCLIIVILWQLQAVIACSIAGLLFRHRRSVILFRGL